MKRVSEQPDHSLNGSAEAHGRAHSKHADLASGEPEQMELEQCGGMPLIEISQIVGFSLSYLGVLQETGSFPFVRRTLLL